MTAALAALMLTGASAAMAQDAAPTAPAQPHGTPVEAPVLEGATVDATCGGLYGLAGQAFCVTAPLAAVGALAEAYIAHFEGQGWLVAAGDDNRVVFIKRRDDGGCDGMQLQAFYDTNRPAAPETPGYIGMATIPGNVCAAQPAAAPTTPPAQ